MKNILQILFLFLCFQNAFSQENTFDESLAKSLGADDYGMKKYVFCLLTTGPNTQATQEEINKAFEGHMANIGRLAKEGKLALAGPFMANSKNYRGIFIFNVSTIEEAQALVETDPAIKAKLLTAEFTPWYATAALMQIPGIHERIAKTKF